MSIIPNCYDYLLGVAQKIIINYADKQTTSKYFNLKQQVLSKQLNQNKKQQRKLVIKNKQNNKFISQIQNKSQESSKLSNFQSDKKESNIKRNKSRKKTMYITPQFNYQNKYRNNKQFQLPILTNLALILKNAQKCPTILKTIDINFENNNQYLNELVSNIQQSLQKLQQKIQKQIQQKYNQLNNKISNKQLINDNKWLIKNIQDLLQQNLTLKRVIGITT